MKNNIFGIWYEPGDTGTWFAWFINQHHGYSKPDIEIRYDDEGDKFNHIATDYCCNKISWYIPAGLHTIPTHAHRFIKSFDEFHKLAGGGDLAYKIVPWHNPFQCNLEEMPDGMSPTQMCKQLLEETNTDAIIIPRVEVSYKLFAKRLAFIRPRFTVEETEKYYRQRMEKSYNNTITQMREAIPGIKIHTIAIDKLILQNDVSEYQKLLDILKVPALDNWTSYTNNYYEKIFAPWEHIKSEELNIRPETLNAIKENPY
jgi:hypothetical protein